MTRFAKRRIILLSLTIVILVAITRELDARDERLEGSSFFSGYLLGGIVVFLALLQLRKQLSMFPLGPMTWWLQTHIYAGLSACWIFAWHVHFRPPNGTFETALFLLFCVTAASGLWGLWISRTYPKKLSKLRDDFIYERIQGLRERVRQQANAIVISLLEQQPATTVGDFYTLRLSAYFEHSRGVWYALRPSSRLRNRLRAEMEDLDRYCSVEERKLCDKLRQLIDRRDDLDFHEALQRQLKGWLFFHISVTYVLLIFGVVHAMLAHAFHGGAT